VSLFSAAVETLQARWAEELVDSCVIKAVSGQTLNTTTGVYAVTYSTTYSGECLVRPSRHSGVQFGQQQTEVRMYSVFVPHTTTALEPDLLVDVTSTDGYLTGRQLVVRNVRGDSYPAIRELECEDTQNV
jgi:hypothetical protein